MLFIWWQLPFFSHNTLGQSHKGREEADRGPGEPTGASPSTSITNKEKIQQSPDVYYPNFESLWK